MKKLYQMCNQGQFNVGVPISKSKSTHSIVASCYIMVAGTSMRQIIALYVLFLWISLVQ